MRKIVWGNTACFLRKSTKSSKRRMAIRQIWWSFYFFKNFKFSRKNSSFSLIFWGYIVNSALLDQKQDHFKCLPNSENAIAISIRLGAPSPSPPSRSDMFWKWRVFSIDPVMISLSWFLKFDKGEISCRNSVIHFY